MRIGIVGAGAIGGWLGVRLARAGHDVSVLARNDTLARLTTAPWTLIENSERLDAAVKAAASADDLGVQDILIITVKGPALANLAPTLGAMIGPDTIIVPAMNGVPWWFLLAGAGDVGPTPLKSVDANGAIASALPYDQVMGCVVHAAVGIGVDGAIHHKAGNRLILGEPNGTASPRLTRLATVFEGAGFVIEQSTAIRYDIWYKLWGNMTMNPISAVTGATADRILDDPLVTDFILRVMAEAQSIGQGIACPIEERGEDRNAVTRQLGAFKTSMLQDAEAGRPLELDQLLSAPKEIATALNIETPHLDCLLGLSRLFARTHSLYPA